MLPQDLHIHTVFSSDDASIVPEQTVELIAAVKHAEVVGISDHFENLVDGKFELYAAEVKKADLKLGIELDGHPLVKEAATYDVDYFIPHVNRFKFVISSDAHQPNWLSQAVARHAARVLGVQEHLVFEAPNLSVIGSRFSDLVSVV